MNKTTIYLKVPTADMRAFIKWKNVNQKKKEEKYWIEYEMVNRIKNVEEAEKTTETETETET